MKLLKLLRKGGKQGRVINYLKQNVQNRAPMYNPNHKSQNLFGENSENKSGVKDNIA